MTVSETDTVVATLVDRGIPTTSTPLEVTSVPSPSLSLSLWPAPIWPDHESKTGSIKSNAPAEGTHLPPSAYIGPINNPTDIIADDEQGKTDGCLARTNTVTTYGKTEAVHDSLDVAACFSRLQIELRKDEEEEAEAEELVRCESEEKEQERRRIVDKRWAERENWMRVSENTSSIDGRLMNFLHHPEIMDRIVGASSGTGEHRTGSGGKFPLDTNMHSVTPSGGGRLPVEPSIPENLPSVPLRFEWGTGPVPGEEKYSSRNSKSAFGCCVVS